jgi:quinol monooxygenase YgiN
MSVLHTAHLRARPDAVEAYKSRLLRHARTSLENEAGGCLRFDVHQDTSDPALFFLLEVYRDQAALDAHRTSPHFAEYRRDTDAWVIDRQWWYWQAVGP